MKKDFESLMCFALLSVFALSLIVIGYMFLKSTSIPENYPTTSHIVQPNETLWGIAKKHYPDGHTGEMVFEIRKFNKLTHANIIPGQVLKIPGR